ncbi:Protein MAIN-LIKE 1 [Glycine max]|nr:Protein MAIN-LIKE 1 [Glycine max]
MIEYKKHDNFNDIVHIMVRIRGFGYALGRAIGKVLGRKQGSDDDNDASRGEDLSHLLAGSDNKSVFLRILLRLQRNCTTRNDNKKHLLRILLLMLRERLELKLSFYGKKIAKFRRLALEIEGLVIVSGLSPLIACSLNTGDRGLISTFVERWHKETSSFHLPVGEVTITLDDVASLLHLSIVRVFHNFEQLHVDDAVDILVKLLEVSAAEARAETIQCHDSYVRLSWLRDVYQMKIEAYYWIVAARVYLLHLLGCTLFANKSVTHVHVVFLDALCDLA